MIRVSVLASSALARAGLEALLRGDGRFAVAASNGHLSRGSSSVGADVLLVELASPERLRDSRLLQLGDGVPAVLLVDHLSRRELRRALNSGARAVLPRDATAPEIVSALEAVAAGLSVLSSDEMEALLPSSADTLVPDLILDEPLSTRELEVLAKMGEGLGNKDIAARLKISEHTVKFHVSSILGKLGVTSRGEAVARGVREGLITI